MNNQNRGGKHHKQKMTIIFFLYLGSLVILFLGVFFSAFSVINNIQLKVLNSSIHGIVFGLLVAYLGIRYYFMVTDFKNEFYNNDSSFSWSNFKKEKRKRRLV
ncbi:MAG: hypothetical protein K0R34_2426 [Herbinix sp.]|jgi:uncharacterized protein YacL|nr:hypothetical protein [Herbinix sp.]